MFATLVRLSKASRKALTPKRGNKDYYKGTRQAVLPGGPRTGAPGQHVVRGKAKYRLLDEKVRYFVAPPLEDILASPLKAYVHPDVKLTRAQHREVLGKLPPGGLNGAHLLSIASKQAEASAPAAQIATPSA